MTTKLNDNSDAPYVFHIGTTGRYLPVSFGNFDVRAWDIKHAIRVIRQQVSKSYSLYLRGPATRD